MANSRPIRIVCFGLHKRILKRIQLLGNGVPGQVEKYLNHEGHFLNMRCQSQCTEAVTANQNPKTIASPTLKASLRTLDLCEEESNVATVKMKATGEPYFQTVGENPVVSFPAPQDRVNPGVERVHAVIGFAGSSIQLFDITVWPGNVAVGAGCNVNDDFSICFHETLTF